MIQTKEIYYCDCCKYETTFQYNFNLHLCTSKHTENIKKRNVKINMEKIKVYYCDHCDKFYRSKQSLENHQLKYQNSSLIKQLNDRVMEENKKLTIDLGSPYFSGLFI